MRNHATIELLQQRILFAAPPTILLDTQVVCTVMGGTAPLATTGSYSVNFRSTKQFYDLADGDVQSSTGKYAYSVVDSKSASLRLDDSLSGTLTGTLTFVTSSQGQFSLTRTGGGTQYGSFDLRSQNMSSISSGVVKVNGTVGSDKIEVYPAGSSSIAITRNNVTQKYPLAMVKRINVFGNEGDDLIAVDHKVGTPLYIIGEGGKDTITGGSGNDTVAGGAGRNLLSGGLGDDRLNGSGASDTLLGQEGADRLYGAGGDDSLDGGGGVDRQWGGLGNDSLVGGSSNDKLFGEDGNDLLVGNAGDDYMEGGDGTDALNGGTGNDTLIGGKGSDGLFGQDGDDMIFAKDGTLDTVVGGEGTDTATIDQALFSDDVLGIESYQ